MIALPALLWKWSRAIKALLTLIFCVSCGRVDPIGPCVAPQVPIEVATYVTEFYRLARQSGTDCFPIKRVDLVDYDISVGGVSGYVGYSDGYGSIVIERAVYEAVPEATRKFIIFHELGHGALWLGHSMEVVNMMAAYIPENGVIEAHWDEMEEKLFLRNLE